MSIRNTSKHSRLYSPKLATGDALPYIWISGKSLLLISKPLDVHVTLLYRRTYIAALSLVDGYACTWGC